MDVPALILAYLLVLLGALGLIAIFYEFRRKRFEPVPSKDNVFRCEKCAFVYTDDADVDRSRCPHCGASNETYRF